MNVITETDRYLFGNGSHYEIYEKLGAHIMEVDGVRGTYFAVWAPNATAVSVVGDFNDWNGYIHIMDRLGTSGIWEKFVPDVYEGHLYKYAITGRDGATHYKADPYANLSEMRPGNASVITNINGYDGAMINGRKINQKIQISLLMSLFLSMKFILVRGRKIIQTVWMDSAITDR